MDKTWIIIVIIVSSMALIVIPIIVKARKAELLKRKKAGEIIQDRKAPIQNASASKDRDNKTA